MKKYIDGVFRLMKKVEPESQLDAKAEVDILTKPFFRYIISSELSLLKITDFLVFVKRGSYGQ